MTYILMYILMYILTLAQNNVVSMISVKADPLFATSTVTA